MARSKSGQDSRTPVSVPAQTPAYQVDGTPGVRDGRAFGPGPAMTTYTNDPNDPCGYCVGWDESEMTDPNIDEARPIWPDGTTVEKMYRYVHAECEASVMRYVAEAARERA